MRPTEAARILLLPLTAPANSSLNMRLTALIINTTPGETTSLIIMANTEGDFH